MFAKFHYINHACFTVEKNNSTIIFDPFLDGNPEGLKVEDIKADYIFISHAHFDHIGSAIEIAKHTGATIISTAEIAGMAGAQGCKAHGMNLGGTYTFPFGKVRMTIAHHSSGIEGGIPCGFIVDFYGTKLYFAGDTALFSDMQLLPRLAEFDYAVLPIGDNFTMGPQDAAIACDFLKAKYAIPVHYNTWPPIAQDPEVFKAEVTKICDTKVLIVGLGETIEIE